MLVIGKIDESWFTPEDQEGEDEENRTRFKVKPLTNMQQLELADQTSESKDGEFQLTAVGLGLAAKMALCGWENVVDERGKKMKFNPVHVKKLPMETMIQIGTYVMENLEPDDEEKKPSS